MLRRFTACLAALLCLFAAPVHAAALNDVAELATLSQWDERFMDNSFKYSNNHFRFGGCGPASLANGVIAALDVTDQDLAAGILRDLLYLLTRSNPNKNKVQIASLDYLVSAAEQPDLADERYPSLNQALRDFGGTMRYYNGNINAKTLPALLPDGNDRPIMLQGSFHSEDRWTNIREVIQTLTDAGYEDARIVLSFLGAGTPGTKSPFRSGDAGHYLCICISMAEFLQTGQFYVLDSLPRALAGEEFGSGLTYQLQYDFLKPQKFSTSLDNFNALFQVERVTPTIVRVVPIGQALESVEAAQRDGALPLDALMPFLLQVVQFNGASHIFITLP